MLFGSIYDFISNVAPRTFSFGLHQLPLAVFLVSNLFGLARQSYINITWATPSDIRMAHKGLNINFALVRGFHHPVCRPDILTPPR